MRQLKELVVINNPIKSVEEDVFWDLPNLEALSIFGALLEKLPANLLIYMTKLKEVSFYGNQLTYIDQNLFRRNLQLEQVVFENNKLTTIKVDFTKFKNIQELSFLGNVCTNLEFKKTIPHLSDSKSLDEFQEGINRNCL